jgi:hypothetical protein
MASPNAAEPISSLCWFSSSPSSQAQLLISLQGGGLLCITPPMQPYSSSNTAAAEPSQALELAPSQLQWQSTATEVPLAQLAAVPASSTTTTTKPAARSSSSSSSGGRSEQQQAAGAHVLGLSSDGTLHRLLPPSDAAGWAAVKGKVLRSSAKLQLASPGAAVTVSPTGQLLMLAGQDGSLTVLPATSAAATAAAAALNSAGSSTGSGVTLAHSGVEGQHAAVLAWGAGGQWAASAAQDGSLLLHTIAGEWDTTPASCSQLCDDTSTACASALAHYVRQYVFA